MNQTKNDIHDTTQERFNGDNAKRYLLTTESFEYLRKAQERIRELTEFTPSIRKLINRLINSRTIDELTQDFINELGKQNHSTINETN